MKEKAKNNDHLKYNFQRAKRSLKKFSVSVFGFALF